MSFEGIAALLAFIVAAYTLLIQTKKSQTAIETILNILLIACVATVTYSLFLLIENVVEHIVNPAIDFSSPVDWPVVFSILASTLQFALSVALVLLILDDITIQFFYRIDRGVILRRLKYWRERRRGHFRDSTPNAIDANVVKPIFELFFYHKPSDDWYFLDRAKQFHQSISILATKGVRQTHHEEVAALILHCLRNAPNTFVEYVSCTRHPIEVVNDMAALIALEENCTIDEARAKLEAHSAKERFVLIDAHTPHFGFGEPVYFAMSRQAKLYALDIIRSGKSFPGVHTALVKGFSKVKSSASSTGHAGRRGNLGVIIFDDLSALADVDSPEQLRLFARHVVASEHLMGGILTVMYESRSAIRAIPFLPEIVDWHFDCHDRLDIAFPPWQIDRGVRQAATKLAEAVRQTSNPGRVLLIAVLNGGAIFADAMARHLREAFGDDFDNIFEMKEMRASKYGTETSGGGAKIETQLNPTEVTGRIVVLLDDICHTGDTLLTLDRHLRDLGARDVWKAVAIQRSHSVDPEFSALTFQKKYPNLENAWMYGFGMDDGGDSASRQIPYFVFSKRG